MTDLSDKNTMIYIRCSEKTKRRFGAYVKLKGYKDYEAALNKLLDLDIGIELV